jgi:hypothetical protein
MEDIKVELATLQDKDQLLEYFKHYNSKEILEKRVDCYLTHNFTVVAKGGEKIIGTLQWCVKEDSNHGLVEFEEIHVLENYRKKVLPPR